MTAPALVGEVEEEGVGLDPDSPAVWVEGVRLDPDGPAVWSEG